MAQSTIRDMPTYEAITALEARLVVLEIVTMSALAMVMDTSETADREQANSLMQLILQTVDHRCDELGLSQQCQKSAQDYARSLLGTALSSLYPASLN
ncbi:hypothetical protein SAMN05880590_111129 [Rhizobium sp. RU35A]|uniref:Uncharacterized protein n=1 Tax=Rhizobium straminoryzae TaxID=1387186 RepID=A0A549T399_9HYPH|nr:MULTISPECIES: hypothetical protein [Rhizobium]TRL36341.1 hypothetical protein FNA46_17995 [Rhizobium straminoryzae]SIR07393.1 hypothetical protein SAMN05880590_111129 [Rhizobium sp. RU35A]